MPFVIITAATITATINGIYFLKVFLGVKLLEA